MPRLVEGPECVDIDPRDPELQKPSTEEPSAVGSGSSRSIGLPGSDDDDFKPIDLNTVGLKTVVNALIRRVKDERLVNGTVIRHQLVSAHTDSRGGPNGVGVKVNVEVDPAGILHIYMPWVSRPRI